jgi:hypothetical protein
MTTWLGLGSGDSGFVRHRKADESGATEDSSSSAQDPLVPQAQLLPFPNAMELFVERLGNVVLSKCALF